MDMALKAAGILGGLLAILSLLAWMVLREMDAIDRADGDEPTENGPFRP